MKDGGEEAAILYPDQRVSSRKLSNRRISTKEADNISKNVLYQKGIPAEAVRDRKKLKEYQG